MEDQERTTFTETRTENRKVFGVRVPYAVLDILQTLVISLSICVVIYIFIATPNQIEGESMEPNFFEGEIILTNKLSEWLGPTQVGKQLGLDYNKGDVVVFQKPGYNDYLKRVIGVSGDKISLKDGFVYINGEKLIEGYLPPATFTRGGSFLKENGEEKTVPEGKYFVMGDNRDNSHDSRYSDIGFVDRTWFKGKVILRYWPINKFTVINGVTYATDSSTESEE
jgi:signal peptidase I